MEKRDEYLNGRIYMSYFLAHKIHIVRKILKLSGKTCQFLKNIVYYHFSSGILSNILEMSSGGNIPYSFFFTLSS